MKTFFVFLVGVLAGIVLAVAFFVLFALAMTDPLTPIKPTSARLAACWRAV